MIGESYKKQGLGESENEFLCPERGVFLKGIPKFLVHNSKVDLDHLICQICGKIIWKVVTCSQPNCFANFCEYCVSNYSQQIQKSDQSLSKCPKCLKKFQKTSIPLINSLLSQLQFKCSYYSEGCEEKVKYDSYLKHSVHCDFRKIQCEGCQQYFLQKQIDEHKKNCSDIVVSCSRCELKLPQCDFKNQHTEVRCLELQLQKKTMFIQKLQESVEKLMGRLNQYENLMQKIVKGDSLQLPYELYSSFPTNFLFNGSEVKLSKSSWNITKEKYDFLHFYVTSPIKTESPIGYQWKLQVKTLKGNLLIGICSSLLISSVDFVINRFGQIKKKESNENKYKLIRKGNLTFSEGDIISFRYLALRKDLKIENETKKVECRLDAKQISELGQNLYSFYSLDTINDTIKFI